MLLRSFLKTDIKENSQPRERAAISSALLHALPWALDLARLSPGGSWLSQEPPGCLPLLSTSQSPPPAPPPSQWLTCGSTHPHKGPWKNSQKDLVGQL